MDARSWIPYGRALLDFSRGKVAAKVIVHETEGRTRKMAMSTFFRKPAEFPTLEQTALNLCRGRVLDIGAGAGCHSLALQERGFSVCAIDISQDAVTVMKKRGVKDVYCADIFDFQAGPFDTILMMMNGIGVVESLNDLGRFLDAVHSLIKPDGQILLDSSDVRRGSKKYRDTDSMIDSESGRYIGEVWFQLEYKGQKGLPFWWLFVDSDTLTEQAVKSGWFCQVIYHEWDGHYLARLVPLGEE
ncbi:MAG: class I SAM-dependent methyltransferase [bacterium]